MRYDEGNISSPSAQQMRDLRKTQNQVCNLTERLLPNGQRGQNDKILLTTRQGKTLKDCKPQTPKPEQAIY